MLKIFLSLLVLAGSVAFSGCDATGGGRARRSAPQASLEKEAEKRAEIATKSSTDSANKETVRPPIAPSPMIQATADLNAAESALVKFDLDHPRPVPNIGPNRAWFAKEGEYSFYGRAIDATSEMVTLKSYEGDKAIEVSIDKLKDEHREQIAESFGEYIKAVAAWKEKRRPAEELVDSRRAELDHLLALEAQAQAEIEAREEAEREREKAIARVRRQDAERKARREKIERSFGIWNGDHTGLTKYIKNRMNNPSSFQHVSTSYSDQGNYLVVFMVYRGSNAFGGIVTKEVSARIDLEGNVLEILTIE